MHMKLFSRDSFLVPTPKKLILAAVLFFLFGWVIWPVIFTAYMMDWDQVGFPLPIRATGLCAPAFVCIEFSWSALIIDAMFWYLASATVIHARVGFWRFCLYFLVTVLGMILLSFLVPFIAIAF